MKNRAFDQSVVNRGGWGPRGSEEHPWTTLVRTRCNPEQNRRNKSR